MNNFSMYNKLCTKTFQFHDCFKSLVQWLDESEISLKQYVAGVKKSSKDLKDTSGSLKNTSGISKDSKEGDELHVSFIVFFAMFFFVCFHRPTSCTTYHAAFSTHTPIPTHFHPPIPSPLFTHPSPFTTEIPAPDVGQAPELLLHHALGHISQRPV